MSAIFAEDISVLTINGKSVGPVESVEVITRAPDVVMNSQLGTKELVPQSPEVYEFSLKMDPALVAEFQKRLPGVEAMHAEIARHEREKLEYLWGVMQKLHTIGVLRVDDAVQLVEEFTQITVLRDLTIGDAFCWDHLLWMLAEYVPVGTLRSPRGSCGTLYEVTADSTTGAKVQIRLTTQVRFVNYSVYRAVEQHEENERARSRANDEGR